MELAHYGTGRELVRYARCPGKLAKEVVLLRGLPCVWSRCTFCDYIDDNTTDQELIRRTADEVLPRVTGEFGRLLVINSGSIQELPRFVQEQIRELIRVKGIRQFFTESYWAYRKDYEATRAFFETDTHLF